MHVKAKLLKPSPDLAAVIETAEHIGLPAAEIAAHKRDWSINELMRDDPTLTRAAAVALYDEATAGETRTSSPIAVPDNLKTEVETILSAYRGIGMVIASQLAEIGLEDDVAANVAIATLLTDTARTAVVAAHALKKRPPRRDWWQEGTTEHFDEAVKWFDECFGEAMAEGDAT